MSRCPDQAVSLKRDLQFLSPQESLVEREKAYLSTHCSRDESLSRPCTAREEKPDLWCGNAIRYHSTTGPYK
ncbi:hypothetical protein TNCV_523511 [Trichonephila clavipes]|nr:hypothetical protein TNCV_523511 [Trichonephila clavipes]